MELEDFTKKIAEQFLEKDQPNVTTEGEFRSLATWDSLTGMAVLTTIQDDYGISVPVDDFLEIKTIKELFSYVQTQRAKK